MESARFWDFAKVPGMIALATAAGFIGSVVGYWFYFRSWDASAFKFLTPGDFSSLAVPIILSIAPVAVPTLLLMWVIRKVTDAVNRPEERRKKANKKDRESVKASYRSVDGKRSLFPEIDAGEVRAFIMRRLRFLLWAAFFTASFCLYYTVFSFVLVRFEFAPLPAISGYFHIFFLGVFGIFVITSGYIAIDQFLEFLGISIPTPASNAVIQSFVVVGIFATLISALVVFQIQSFQASIRNAKLAEESECFTSSAQVRLSSRCILHSLERGIIFYDAREEILKFRYHQENIVVSLKTPGILPEKWGDDPWLKAMSSANESLSQKIAPFLNVSFARSMGFIRGQCEKENTAIVDQEKRAELTRICIEERRDTLRASDSS